MRWLEKGARVAAVVAFALVLGVAPAHADKAGEIVKLIEEAKDHLDDMAAKLKTLDSDKDSSPALDAAREAVELKKTLLRLEKAGGEDKNVKAVTDGWQQPIKNFMQAVLTLGHMKGDQFKIDTLADECRDEAKKFKKSIDAAKKIKDPADVKILGDASEKLAKDTKAKLRAAERVDVGMLDDAREMGRLKGSKEWQKVIDAVSLEAKQMRAYTADKMKLAEKACTQLTLGKRHPDFIEVRQEILKAVGANVADFQERVDLWEEKAADFFERDCKAMQEIADAFCTIDQEATERGGNGKAYAKGSEVAAKMEKIFKVLLEEIKGLHKTAKNLRRRKSLDTTVKSIVQETVDETKKLAGIRKNGSIAARRHPTIDYYISYGQKMHKQMESREACNVRDKAYPKSKKGRPDCVRARGCIILEFKPNSDSARVRGLKQLREYKSAVDKFYNEVLKNPVKTKSQLNNLGGQRIMDEFKRYGCIKSGKISLKTDIKKYDRCKAKYRCVK